MKLRNRLMTLAFALCAVSSAAFAMNVAILDELGFEKGGAAWKSWGDGDIKDEYYGVKPHEGSFFLRLWSRSGWYQDFSTKQGNTYSISAYVASAKTDALWGDAFAELKVEWRNRTDGDVEVGQATSVKFDLVGKAGTTIAVDQWTKIALALAKAPPNATHGRVLLTIWTDGGQKGGGCALFDDVGILQTP